MAWIEFTNHVLQTMAGLFILALVLLFILLAAFYIIDRRQTHDAIRRNYPVIGRFRRIFTELGEFFRQYFFAMDREELPFNRAQRDWVARATTGQSNTIAFGSTRNLKEVGTPIFINASFPPLDQEASKTRPLRIGPFAEHPYDAPSFFNISGMSYGALSAPAIEALSKGAAKAGIWLNTGEGGLSQYHLSGGCDLVFQIGTAKYGVRDKEGRLSDQKLREIAAYTNVKMFELKLAQGAKPGKGGMLPGSKVDAEVAAIRGINLGEDSISPNRHPEIYSTQSLLETINHIRDVTGKPTGFKTVMGQFDGLAELLDLGLATDIRSLPDFISIDGGDGGTGAAPMPLMDLVGLPLREALPRVSDLLHERGLRERVRLIASGKLINPGDVALAIAWGADFVATGRGFMFSLGCIQALKCNKNTCPTGITTHDPRLQKGLVVEEKYEKVANYANGLVQDVEILAHSVGAVEPREINRNHVRIVQGDGTSVPLSEVWPRPEKLS